MIDLTKTFRVFIVTTVVYIILVLLSVFIMNSTVSEESVNTFRGFERYSEDFVTNCNLQPKRCPNPLSCDCSIFCNDPAAKRFVVDARDHPLNVRFQGHLHNGTYCYVPFGNDCKEGYGVWVYRDKWYCLPVYPGQFKTTGEIIKKETDEYDNEYKTVNFKNGLSFRVKDYCLSKIKKNPATGYSDGKCICDKGTENFVLGNVTSPCVYSNPSLTQGSNNNYAFKVECFDENTFVKDLKESLFKCPANVPMDKHFLLTNEHNIYFT